MTSDKAELPPTLFELATLVARMRKLQREYFRAKGAKSGLLSQCIVAEGEVDKAVKRAIECCEQTPSLFPVDLGGES